MITLFPIAIWSKATSGTNGINWPGFCWTRRDHPFAAAIMAQEIYESRFKTIRLAILAAPLVAVALWFNWHLVPFAIVPALLILGLYRPWLREVELRGQAIEVAVRDSHYGTPIATAVSDAASQLSNYEQFEGQSLVEIKEGIAERLIDHALPWAKRNRLLIDRAFKEATA